MWCLYGAEALEAHFIHNNRTMSRLKASQPVLGMLRLFFWALKIVV